MLCTRYFLYVIAILSICIESRVACSQEASANKAETTTGGDADLNAIRKQAEAFTEAFNKKDAKAVASLWTEKGEFIDESGDRYVGRDAIEKCYLELFATVPDAQVSVLEDSLHLVGETIAIEEGIVTLKSESANSSSQGRYRAVHSKVNGKWLIASVRDEHYEPPTDARSAADLEWLVGNWVTENVGAKSESVCTWVADNHFLERRYTTTMHNGQKSNGIQIIGWNPLEGSVQSWDFSSNGGHAVGMWSAVDGGWQAEVRGTTPEGLPTYAVNTLRRLDDNAYVWRSTDRSIGENQIADTDEIIFKRARK